MNGTIDQIKRLHRDAETGGAAAQRAREQRDRLIRREVEQGRSQRSLAALLGMSHQRVAQIVNQKEEA